MAKKLSMGELRIIAGQWRGRKIAFYEVDGLRPTSSRIRETLFNWLAPFINQCTCLDLFAGSGALGFEALSRGAVSVTMVEQHPKVARQLKQIQRDLEIENLRVIEQDAFLPLSIVSDKAVKFDVVFCDPPFNKGFVPPLIKRLNASPYLAEKTMVYIETEKNHAALELPDNWQLLKDKKAGDVRYRLYEIS